MFMKYLELPQIDDYFDFDYDYTRSEDPNQ